MTGTDTMTASIYTALFIYIAIGVVLVAILTILGYRWYLKRNTHLTKKRVTNIFRAKGRYRNFVVMTDVDFGDGIIADQVVVAPFGVMIACDLHQNGKIYGDLNSEEWIDAKGEDGAEKKVRFASPLYKLEQSQIIFRKKLAQAKIYSVPVETILVKTQDQKCYITGLSEKMYSLGKLRELLSSSKYEKDNKVNVQGIVDMLKSLNG